MDEILSEFVVETKDLSSQLEEILDQVEDDPAQFAKLAEFGQIVDRIMGGAKVLALDYAPEHPLHALGNFSELCKLIGYKASQCGDKPALVTTSVAFLLDANESLNELSDLIASGKPYDLKDLVRQTFFDRLKWLATKFDDNLAGSVSITQNQTARSTQDDVDAILKQLGVK